VADLHDAPVTSLLIVNPFASGVDEHRLAAVRAALPQDTEPRLTTAAGEATRIARSAADVDAIYVFGGDGTFNEVLNGIELDVPLGFIPGGGTSVLPRALGLPRNPARAAQRISQGTTRRIGLGRVNGRRFGFSAGIGLDAELVRKVDQLGRSPDGRRPGDIAFMRVAGSMLWARRAHFDERLEVEGAGRAAFVLVANCSPYTYAGTVGLDLVPGADFDAGLAYLAPVTLRARDLPRVLLRGAHGTGIRGGNALAATDVDRIVIRCDEPLPLQVDGEDAGDISEAVYEAERDAVTVLV
jgi:diacylglycerol kinase family enzyme